VLRFVLTMLAVVSSGVAATAQVRVVRYGDDRLTGITRVDLFVEEIGADGGTCGLLRSTVQTTSLAALRGSGLQSSISEKSSSWFYTVQVRTESAIAGTQCVTSIASELVAQVDGIPEADRFAPLDRWGSLLVGQLLLLRETRLLASERSTHAADVQSVLNAQMRRIGERIGATNR
jgi:hypothetical protein